MEATNADEYGPQYSDHLFEQHKLYVEGVEKNSDRRQSAVERFLTLHAALFTLVGLTMGLGSSLTKYYSRLAISLAGLCTCIIFFFLIRAYKQLASGKFAVIHEIEEKLPLRLYAYEWKAKLGEGKSWKKYFPFSHIEMLLPIIFGGGYIVFAVFTWYCHSK